MKALNSTSSSFGINKLAQQNSMTGNTSLMMRKTSFTMTRNTQGRLDTLKDDLFYLNGDIL